MQSPLSKQLGKYTSPKKREIPKQQNGKRFPDLKEIKEVKKDDVIQLEVKKKDIGQLEVQQKEIGIEIQPEQVERKKQNYLMSLSHGINFIGAVPSLISQLSYGIRSGGPVMMSLSFMIAFVFEFFICLSFAEICSTFPQNGSCFYWCFKMSKNKLHKFFAYSVGMIYTISGFSYIAISSLQMNYLTKYMIQIFHPEYTQTQFEDVMIAILFNTIFYALIIFDIYEIGWINSYFTFQQIFSIFIVSFALYIFAPIQENTAFIFTKFYNETNIENMLYLGSIGFMLPIYSVSGFDSAGQLASETDDPETNTPYAIIRSFMASYFVSFLLLFAFLKNLGGSSDEYLNSIANSSNALMEVLKNQFKNQGVILFLNINIWAMFFCTQLSGRLGTTRVAHAMCIQDLFPFSTYFKKLNYKFNSPIRIIVMLALITNILMFITLVNKTMYFALGDFCSAAAQYNYLLVIIIRLDNDQIDFSKSKFNLGKYTNFINKVSLFWLLYTISAVLIPNLYLKGMRLDIQIFNWAPVMLILALTYVYFQWKQKEKDILEFQIN